MSAFQIISRKDLYDGNLDGSQNTHDIDVEVEENQIVQLAPTDFEIVDVQQNNEEVQKQQETTDEFEFPLFSFGATSEPADHSADSSEKQDNNDDSRGRAEVRLMKISLREPSPEIIIQDRPKSYYFSEYSERDKENFISSAIKYDDIFKDKDLIVSKPSKKAQIIDLNEYNAQAEKQLQRERLLRKRRPCKKQRLARKMGQEMVKEREALAKKLKKEMKKKFHQRGGKKNKKKPTMNPLANAGATPKFRTE